MSRRPSIGVARRQGFRGIGGGVSASAAAAYSPTTDPLALLWWDPTTVSGAVSSWVDALAGVDGVQATAEKRPAASATAIDNAYPGVSSDGGDELVAMGAGIVLTGKTVLTLTLAIVDTAVATTAVPIEYTPNVGINNGGAGLYTDTSNRLHATCRGTVGLTDRHAPLDLATVAVVSIGYSFVTAGAGAIAFVRSNGVAQTLTNTGTASAAGSAANSGMYFFARGGSLMLPWTGVLGDVLWRESASQDAALEAAEDFIAARCGLSF